MALPTLFSTVSLPDNVKKDLRLLGASLFYSHEGSGLSYYKIDLLGNYQSKREISETLAIAIAKNYKAVKEIQKTSQILYTS